MNTMHIERKKMMSITLRLENENDYREVEDLTREAFWDLYHPGACEHLIVHKIRQSPSFVPELDFVALQGNSRTRARIVGNIIYSISKVMDEGHMSRK